MMAARPAGRTLEVRIGACERCSTRGRAAPTSRPSRASRSSTTTLVPTYIPEIPRPRIGLIDHEGENFRYTNFGDSFALEFTSILWMLCAYSPRYPFERDTMSTPAGRWTCEENPPPLW
jgi:hypothetical protein